MASALSGSAEGAPSRRGVRGGSHAGSKGGTITLRHGAVLLQNLTLEEARVLTAEFCASGVARGFSPSSQGSGRMDADAWRPDTVLEDAQGSAKQLLDSILVAFPKLGGQAASSVGTALRVEAVRAKFEKVMVRPQLPLLRTLGHIANAADAGRHLSCQLVQEATILAISSLHAVDDNDIGSTAKGDSRSVAVGTDVPRQAVECFSICLEGDECSARDVDGDRLSTAASRGLNSLDASADYSDYSEDVVSELASLVDETSAPKEGTPKADEEKKCDEQNDTDEKKEGKGSDSVVGTGKGVIHEKKEGKGTAKGEPSDYGAVDVKKEEAARVPEEEDAAAMNSAEKEAARLAEVVIPPFPTLRPTDEDDEPDDEKDTDVKKEGVDETSIWQCGHFWDLVESGREASVDDMAIIAQQMLALKGHECAIRGRHLLLR